MNKSATLYYLQVPFMAVPVGMRRIQTLVLILLKETTKQINSCDSPASSNLVAKFSDEGCHDDFNGPLYTITGVLHKHIAWS